MGCYGHRLSNGVLFAYHLILDVPGGSSHLGYRRRVPLWHNPTTRVKTLRGITWCIFIRQRTEFKLSTLLYRLLEPSSKLVLPSRVLVLIEALSAADLLQTASVLPADDAIGWAP